MKREEIEKRLKDLLDKERYAHSLSVAQTAVELATKYKANVKKAGLAGLLHDCAKWMTGKQLLEKAKTWKIKTGPFFKKQPKLLHSYVSAVFAKKEFGVKDRGILSAIANHTTGRPGMSELEKIIYVADHTEPGRTHKHARDARLIADLDLDKSIAMISTEMIRYLLDNNLPVFEQTIATRNYYLENR